MKTKNVILLLLIAMIGFSCQDMVRPDFDYVSDNDPSLSGPLQRLFAFEGTPVDSVLGVRGTATGVSYIDGVKGKAYKGSRTGQIVYNTAGELATMESFTFAFWMKAESQDGAQAVFMLPNTEDFWGNTFMTIDGEAKNDSMRVKFNFAGNWFDFAGNGTSTDGLNRLPDAYGKWRHVAFTYDAATSKFAAYYDGSKLPLAASVTNLTKGGSPLGALKFANVSKFIIGGFQQQIGIGNAPDPWMKHYTGGLDQFRVYTTALPESEIKALYDKRM